jgi:two-component system NarL family sensor kinase
MLPVHLPGQEGLQDMLAEAYEVRVGDRAASNELADRVIERAVAVGNDSVAVEALILKGWNLQGTGDYAASNKALLNARQRLPDEHPLTSVALIEGRIGKNYSEMGDYRAAMTSLVRYDSIGSAINALWDGVDNRALMLEPKLFLGELYEYLGRPEDAERYYVEAYELAKEKGNRFQRIMTLYYILDFALVRQKRTSGYQEYLDEYLELLQSGQSATVDLGHAHMLFFQMDAEEKIKWLNQMRLNVRTSSMLTQYFVHHELIRTYLDQGEVEKAIAVAEVFDTKLEKHNIPVRIAMHSQLADLYERVGRYREANRELQSMYAIRDSLHAVEIQNHVDSLNILFQTAQKEEQMQQQELQIARQKAQRRTLLFSLAGVVWFGAFLVLFFWNKNRLTARIAAQESALQAQKINQLEQEKKLLAMSSMIEGQEAERKRIAQDLHDGLGGLLSTVKAQLNTIQHQVSKLESFGMYQKATDMIDDASSELRRITYNMMPSALTKLGLYAAVEDLADRLKHAHNINVDLQILGARKRLNETTEIMLYRIVQELCNNIVKHAQAANVLLQINDTGDELFLVVEDNGAGFRYDQTAGSKSVGLKSIESRVRFLNGELDISSTPGQGTCTTIQVPLA